MVGGVVRVGGPKPAPKQLAPAPTHQTLDADFTPIDEEQGEPANVLAVAEPPETVEEFEETFGGKRLVEAILFYTEDGTLLPPLADIVIVEGSSVHRKYQEAGIEVEAVPAAQLIEWGFCNDFLLALAGPKESALVADLRAKLKEPIQHHRPSHHVEVGKPDAEAQEDARMEREAEAAHARGHDLRSHPRAYYVGTLQKPRPTPGKGEREVRIDSGERTGYGVAPPGGVSVTQFPRPEYHPMTYQHCKVHHFEQRGMTWAPFVKMPDGGFREVHLAPLGLGQEAFIAMKEREGLGSGPRGTGKTRAQAMTFLQHVGRGFGSSWKGIWVRPSRSGFTEVKAQLEQTIIPIWGDHAKLQREQIYMDMGQRRVIGAGLLRGNDRLHHLARDRRGSGSVGRKLQSGPTTASISRCSRQIVIAARIRH